MDPGRGDSLRAAPRKAVATAQAVAGPDRGLPEGEVKSVPTLGRLTPADVGCWTGWCRRMLDLGCWLNPLRDSARTLLPDLMRICGNIRFHTGRLAPAD